MKVPRSSKLLRRVSRLWAPPAHLTLTEWAEEYFYLSSEASAKTGYFRAKPFQRAPLDAVTDPRVETVVIMSATQMLKTTIILIALGYFIDRDPGPIMMIAPRDSDVDKFSKIRLAPMLRDTPCLQGKVSESKSRDNQNTLNYKKFDGGHLAMTGSGSPGNLAALPIRYLMCDEVDKYPHSSGNEGDPISLARKRTITYRARRKMILTCSPTVKGRSRIAKAYYASDRREFTVPCPHCGVFQILKWAQVKWNSTLPKEEQAATAYYECEHCEAHWDDFTRRRQCELGVWEAQGVFTGSAGFRISELVSPWRTLAEIVGDFLEMKDDPERLKTFINTTLAELWEEEGETPEWEKLYARRESYPHGDDAVVPARGLFLTCAVDVQDDRLEWEVIAWGRGKENWSVAYGVIRCENGQRTSDPRVWTELDKVLARDWQHEAGAVMPIMVMAIDTGSRPRPVYDFAMRHARPAYGPAGGKITVPRTVVPIKGSSQNENYRIITGITGEDAAKKRGGIRIVSVGTGTAKQQIYDSLRLPRPVNDEPLPTYPHFPEYGEEYFQGLCSEKRIAQEDGKVVWEKMGRNEPLDLRVYNTAAATLFGIDRFREREWSKLEDLLGLVEQEAPVVVPPVPPDPIAPPPQPQRPQVPVRRVVRSRWLNR